MSLDTLPGERIVQSVHGRRAVSNDPVHETGLIEMLRKGYGPQGLIELYGRFAIGDGAVDTMMRKVIVNAAAKSCGPGLQVGTGVGFKHLETLQFGPGVFLGAQAYIQGRYDGTCIIGQGVWIGPQAYFDARDLYIGGRVGWGPGAKVLGSQHTAIPTDRPIVETDLMIRPVRIEEWADIGTNAVILPGVTVGKGAIVGAGAVVTSDVAPFSVVAGVPARFLRWRKDNELGDAASRRGE